jgi:hypothetical protein
VTILKNANTFQSVICVQYLLMAFGLCDWSIVLFRHLCVTTIFAISAIYNNTSGTGGKFTTGVVDTGGSP